MISNLTLPAFLTLLMGVIYKFFEGPNGVSSIPDIWKTRIVILAGMGVGVLSLFYNGTPLTEKNIIDSIVGGLGTGFTSIGMWKGLGVVNAVQNSIQSVPLNALKNIPGLVTGATSNADTKGKV